MRLAIISDTHFGDPACGLVSKGTLDKSRFNRFKEAALKGEEPLDFLVLVGDVFDFAIASYEEAYDNAKVFFQAVNGKIKGEEKQPPMARQIIYVPGNHDGDFAHLVDYEVNVIKKIRKCEPPLSLDRSMPGVLDDRPDAPQKMQAIRAKEAEVQDSQQTFSDGRPIKLHSFFWPKKKPLWFHDEKARMENAAKTGELKDMRDGIFLDRLFCDSDNDSPPEAPKVWVCYPNLYLITPENKQKGRDEECVLITHGHYFETFWALGGQVGLDLVKDDLREDDESKPPVYSDKVYETFLGQADSAGMNFPLNQLSCTGIGQAAPLTKVVRDVQKDVKRNEPARLDKYISRLPASLAKRFDLGFAASAALKLLVAAIRPIARKAVKNFQDSRGNSQFLNDKLNQVRVGSYYLSCLQEIKTINNQFYDDDKKSRIQAPKRMIWGHTHEPTGWKDGDGLPFPKPIQGRRLITHNCGGWLEDDKQITPAEVFHYSTDKAFCSTRVK
ncbi:metallophosphoesterase [Desulfatibacillum aliphaticivorans]|uniref:Metallophosphoesterase n=1 Tax=Desulfatibacillum aliphaticivorans TaxID=218208 RepID=B8FDL4_DESAL|nr:metallophosphoesterase [Desulfatibacillum aliphaticivorans]ACL06645.1 metallophosphoesterase [Desulfatibacillum aliphaticivorans]